MSVSVAWGWGVGVNIQRQTLGLILLSGWFPSAQFCPLPSFLPLFPHPRNLSADWWGNLPLAAPLRRLHGAEAQHPLALASLLAQGPYPLCQSALQHFL